MMESTIKSLWVQLFLASAIALGAFALAISATGCGNPATVQHPGAINATDSNLYDALLSAQGALDDAKMQYAGLTVALQKTVGPTLNKIIADYNAAQDSYKLYHTGGSGGDPMTIQQQINQLITDIAGLVRQMK